MFDYRLKVFHTVAQRLNFTKAAEELFITQPAVSKHIQEIETFYKTKLFERNGTKIKLTQAGALLLQHTASLINTYRAIEFDLAALSQNIKGVLRIGASTTVAQYFLPKYLASFRKKFPDVKVSLTVHNTELVENLLAEGKIDAGIVEGQSKRTYLKYTRLSDDEMVLCTAATNASIKKTNITLKELSELPLVIREHGSGSLEVIRKELKKAGIDFNRLKIEMELESTESTKAYLQHSNAFSFLSVHSISKELKNGDLKMIEVKGLNIKRCFYFVTQHGDAHHLQEVFYKHLASDNFKL